MALKVVGKSPRGPRMSFGQSTANPGKAKGARLKCEGCGKTISVMFPWGLGWIDRQKMIRDAADEHRRITCTAGVTEDHRKFEIWYPRQNSSETARSVNPNSE
jgi:hypothetical protein